MSNIDKDSTGKQNNTDVKLDRSAKQSSIEHEENDFGNNSRGIIVR